ncbi:hypothetical protein J6590_053414 [Homalodisca vitripennis]|nr:hypothetical protein J6590_053414 [Homalodisca vitripennis]
MKIESKISKALCRENISTAVTTSQPDDSNCNLRGTTGEAYKKNIICEFKCISQVPLNHDLTHKCRVWQVLEESANGSPVASLVVVDVTNILVREAFVLTDAVHRFTRHR